MTQMCTMLAVSMGAHMQAFGRFLVCGLCSGTLCIHTYIHLPQLTPWCTCLLARTPHTHHTSSQLYDLDAINFEDGPPTGTAMATYTPQHTLQPPHYDAVTSFAVHSRFLFSSCGVTIKQWDMKLQSLKQVGVA